MSELVVNCPRCRANRMTFDLVSEHFISMLYGWQRRYEAFCICRECSRPTIFLLHQKEARAEDILRKTGLSELPMSVNRVMDVISYVSLKDMASAAPPKHLPDELDAAFREAATCVAVQCPNAAGTMFRLCIDLATRSLLPKEQAPGLNARVRRDLGLRLPWLFDNGRLSEDLRDLSTSIQQDGNDGAHAGTLKMEDAEDLRDFAIALLERMYTEPEKLRLAMERRARRRAPKK